MTGILLLIVSCLAMCALLLIDGQWKDKAIHYQHLANEVGFYFLCCCLLGFCGVISDAHSNWQIGFLVILVIVALIFYNILVIVYVLARFVKLLIKRYFIMKFGKVNLSNMKAMILCRKQPKVLSPDKTRESLGSCIDLKEYFEPDVLDQKEIFKPRNLFGEMFSNPNAMDLVK